MNFILITGPPAVGKMTVGEHLAERLDYKLFHNHYSIELALSMFPYGTEDFEAVNQGIRDLVFKTAAQSKSLKGLIFTLVWAFDLEEDWEYVRKIKAHFEPHDWDFYFVELYAPMDVRLERNKTPRRLAAKASKRDVESSDRGVREMEEEFEMNTDGSGIGEANYLWIDNSDLSATAVAERVIREFGLGD
ncbi:AAA family ATPase [Flavilitoribacter nigricans]|uniref:Shikimate kinase n=1 Tax=Flavilitoribacter nigricans (strain ATCC 23147 / DSM 23189 / NBRC 102662 / NCIMB 1420 / SS-2) TaxID=1122177 RepID=A0A2D0NAP2_FLAN2|nr:AAA family ATPase [Flavilitoribacter nigricans]PHN05430.1 shikimate kinase [Flavilitoribacter nigricans DSM 23189 = NBRC 102662]